MEHRYRLDTRSGRVIDLSDPRPTDIVLEDVAGGLAQVCRFAAQCKEFYSVAQHSVLVSHLVVTNGHPELELAALHHDSHEAYVGDLATSIKKLMDEGGEKVYRKICAALDEAIAEAFDFLGVVTAQSKEIIKRWDDAAFLIESRALLHPTDRDRATNTPFTEQERENLPPFVGSDPPESARATFTAAHDTAVARQFQRAP
jgi:uncharacterized protein